MAKNNLMLTVIVAIVVGGLAFYGGMLYQKSQRTRVNSGQLQGGPNGVPSGTQTRNGKTQNNRPVSGEIISVENNTITVKTQDGSSKIVIYSDSTTVSKTSDGSKDDLKIGEQVTVTGSEGTDGTVTAQTMFIGGSMMQQGIGMPSGQPPEQPTK